jgi:hypothetical protein
MLRFSAMPRRAGVLFGALVALSLAPLPATAQGCPFGRDITVSGQIQGVDLKSDPKELETKIVPFRGCEIWIIGFEGALPAACQKGRRFTATGRIGRSLVLPDGLYMLWATRLSCQ